MSKPGMEMLSEPVSVPDTYCSGLAHAEELDDGNMRLTFFTRRNSCYGGDEFTIESRLILPISAVYAFLETTSKMVRRHVQ